MTSNWPKIDFSVMEIWLLSESRIFRPWILKTTITKYTMSTTTANTACNDVLFHFKDVYDRSNYLLNFRQKLRLFLDIYFCIDCMIEMAREDNLTTHFRSTWSRATNKIAYTSTERGCQSKCWQKRMETKKKVLVIFHTPVLPVDKAKIN